MPRERVGDVDLRFAATSPAEQSFVTTYEILFPRLCRFAERFLPADDAEDAVQTALTRIWSNWEVISLDGPQVPFFFRSVRNEIVSARRGLRAEQRGLGEYLYEWTRRSRRRDAADARLEQAELAAVIDAAVAGLPERCREAWLLVRENDLSYERAAEAMDISMSTAKKHMTFAQNALREALTDAGYRDAARAATTRRLPASTPGEDTP